MSAAARDAAIANSWMIDVGTGPAHDGAHFALATRIASAAVAKGLKLLRIERSRVPHSRSIYLSLADRREQRWRLRIADHKRPDRAAIPHFDLVSRDGLAGYDVTVEALTMIADGRAPWFDSDMTAAPLEGRERKRIAAHHGRDGGYRGCGSSRQARIRA